MNKELPNKLGLFISHFLRPYKKTVVFYVCLAFLAGFWGPFNSLLIKHMINTISSSKVNATSALTWPAILLVANFIVFDNFTWRTIGFLNYKFQPVIKKQVISETFNFILGSSNQFFTDNLSGRISSHINTLADNIERILHLQAKNFIRGVSLLVVALISMCLVSVMFFCTLLLWFIAFATFSVIMSKRLVSLEDIHTESEAIVSGQMVDGITNASNIRIFARRIFEVLRLDKALLVAKNTFQARELFLLKLYIVQGTLIAIMLGVMVYFLINLYARNLISVGDFSLILGLTMEVGYMTWFTMGQVDEFNKAVGKCKQSLSSIIFKHEITDVNNAASLSVTKGGIIFSKVKFHYKGTTALFENKSITIDAGQKVGLVGYSGSGKSTFVNLILRLYELTDGQILIDGQDISQVSQDSLHQQIAMIPQEPSLFHRSLLENIRYGKIEASDDEVMTASAKAHAHEFIIKLQQGYASLVGERGVKLSGGQRQRIAIARAILKNSPILLLDEATSQLDSVTENHIQESLWQLMQDKTTIIVAHRLSTLLHMDRILVFDQGKIIEDGAHDQLLAKNGLYKTLWNAQVGGFLPEKKA